MISVRRSWVVVLKPDDSGKCDWFPRLVV
eukprot:COSAG02_NODE_46862_length_345_cov_1.056911_2_plen_28_part_01